MNASVVYKQIFLTFVFLILVACGQNSVVNNGESSDSLNQNLSSVGVSGSSSGAVSGSSSSAISQDPFFPLDASDSTFIDMRDAHEYKKVKIGKQVWMAENLAYLPEVNPASQEKANYVVPGYEGVSVQEAKATDFYRKYGAQYSWYTSMNSCPIGWHTPTDEEWQELEDFVIASLKTGGISESGADTLVGNVLKSTSGWDLSNNGQNGSDIFGFSVLPAGWNGNYEGVEAGFWSSTANGFDTWRRYFSAYNGEIQRTSMLHAGYTYQPHSVRCVENSTQQSFESSLIDERDGTEYRTVKISGVRWMAEDLMYIPSNADVADSSYEKVMHLSPEGSAVSSEFKPYYVLYSPTTAMESCPSGWRIAGETDWEVMELELGSKPVMEYSSSFSGNLGWLIKHSSFNGIDSVGMSILPPSGVLDESGNIVMYWTGVPSAGKDFVAFKGFGRMFDRYEVGSYIFNATKENTKARVRCIEGENTSSSIVPGSFTDSRDAKVYQTVRIDGVNWLAENLAYLPVDATEENYALRSGTYSDVAIAKQLDVYKNNGVYYSWNVAQDACPTGWELPTRLDLVKVQRHLERYFGYESRLTALKAAGQWSDYNDESLAGLSGLQILPTGEVEDPENPSSKEFAKFWTSEEFSSLVWMIAIQNRESLFWKALKTDKLNIRCVEKEQ